MPLSVTSSHAFEAHLTGNGKNRVNYDRVYKRYCIDVPWHAQIPWFLGQWKALIARVHAQRVLGSSSFPQMLRVCALVLVHAHAKSPTCMRARAAAFTPPPRLPSRARANAQLFLRPTPSYPILAPSLP